ncbi:MAG: aldolase/citrate lyase family protein [Dehalococcoidia bacterium]
MPPIRSMVLVAAPGAGLEAALESPADAICLTLSDGRFPISELREAAAAAIPRIAAAGKRALVKVNHPRTQLLRADLEATVSSELFGVLLTQVAEPQDVRDLAVALREFEYERGVEPGLVQAFPVISSAPGLVRAVEVASASPRRGGLIFDGAGYAEDVVGRDEESGPRFAYARGAVVGASRAFNGTPLVFADGIDMLPLAQSGFGGAVIRDSRLAGAANAAFTPTAAALDRARAHRETYAAARADAAWAGRFGDNLVDLHQNTTAAQLIE